MTYSTLNARRINPLLDRACLKCDARMWLVDIEPDQPGQHKLAFDCVVCGDRESVLLKINSNPRSPATGRRSPWPEWLGMARRAHGVAPASVKAEGSGRKHAVQVRPPHRDPLTREGQVDSPAQPAFRSLGRQLQYGNGGAEEQEPAMAAEASKMTAKFRTSGPRCGSAIKAISWCAGRAGVR